MTRSILRTRPLFYAVSMIGALAAVAHSAQAADQPNVVLVITDDQGYGDIHAHGNEMIRTPNLDKLYAHSVRLTDFHVDPTCSPTRSALMTGRYSTRTGVWHTIMGRSLMNTEELTIAEVFQSAGYRTAMFGKWHLGDNYPCRPQDQGFDETFYNGGGGVTQTPDYFGNDYFDDTYFRGGVPEPVTGYCTDIWFDNALEFIERNARQNRPFFTYLSTNAPHGPYLVAQRYSKPYQDKRVPATMARFYGMITNIDENMGRLVAKLDQLGIAQNTILIFMTDNGTAAGVAGSTRGRSNAGTLRESSSSAAAWRGFNAGMRGKKGSEYDGGHRVPLFIRWPGGGLTGGRDVHVLAAHIDVLPTLVELCAIQKPKGPSIDGVSLAHVLGGMDDQSFPHKRTLFVHSQRIEHPEKWRKVAVMTKRWRHIGGKELYDIKADPGQTKNVAQEYPRVASELRQAYLDWWASLSPVFDDYVPIHLGNDAENPANLTCHDWHTNNAPVPWNQKAIQRGPMNNGFWAVHVEQDGEYEITLRRWPKQENRSIEATRVRLKIGDVDLTRDVSEHDTAATLRVHLSRGATQIETWLTVKNGKTRGAYFVEVKYLK